MRRMLLAFLIGYIALAPITARSDPPERLIVEMALLRMVERVDYLYNARFGPSVVYPQPEGRYWAVVGELVSGTLRELRQSEYIAAIRLICDDTAKSDCWRLEKLAINGEIVFDRGVPL